MSGFNHDASTARCGFNMHIFAHKAWGNYLPGALICTVKKTMAYFLWSGAGRITPHVHYYPDRPPPRGWRKRGRSDGGLEEKNRKSAAMEFYSPRPFNGPFNTASSAADTSQALHLAAAIAQTASQYSARPYTHPQRAQSQNERLSEQIKINKGSDASACKKQNSLRDPVRWR